MLNKHHWSHTGYDAEELYFAKLNRELIERIKAERDKGERTPMPEGHTAEIIQFPVRSIKTEEKKAA